MRILCNMNYKLLFSISLVTVLFNCLVACDNDDDDEVPMRVSNDIIYVESFENEAQEKIVLHAYYYGIVYKYEEDSDNGYYEVKGIKAYMAPNYPKKPEIMPFSGSSELNAYHNKWTIREESIISISKEEYEKFGFPLNEYVCLTIDETNIGRYYHGMDSLAPADKVGLEGIPYGSVLSESQWTKLPIQRKGYLRQVIAEDDTDKGLFFGY